MGGCASAAFSKGPEDAVPPHHHHTAQISAVHPHGEALAVFYSVAVCGASGVGQLGLLFGCA